MSKKIQMSVAFMLILCLCGCGYMVYPGYPALEPADQGTESQEAISELTVSNGLFSITLPADMSGLFEAETTDNSITIYDKEEKDAGFGGNVFDVSAYKEPSEYAGGMDVKVGEFTAEDGTLYDIALQYPSDVQYDYTKYTDDMPKNYKKLTEAAEDIAKTLTGADGSGSFIWGAGTKGEDLYQDVLATYVKAIEEGWDANRLEEEDMSSMYYAMASYTDGNVLDAVGYAYFDTNHDGVDELLIGEIAEGDWKGVVYDIYTMVDRAPAHVLSGWDRSRYYALESGMIVNEYSGGAAMTGWDVFDIGPNSTDIIPQISFKVDEYENEEKPWFISFDDGETWESQTEDEFEEFLSRFKDYKRFDYTPLSECVSAENEEIGEPESDADYLGVVKDHEQMTSTEGCDTFTQMVDRMLSDGQGYANAKLGDTDVLVVAGSTFSGYGEDAAVDAELFCYKEDGSIAYLGFVQSGGSANPLAVKDGMLYTAGHHYVGKHTVTDGKLMTVEEAWETFDTDGNSTYHYSSDDGGDYSDLDSDQAEQIFDELYKECLEADIIVFDTIVR